MHSTDKAGRVAEAIYLLGVVAGPSYLVYVPNAIIATGNAAATASNTLAHETSFRLGTLGDPACRSLGTRDHSVRALPALQRRRSKPDCGDGDFVEALIIGHGTAFTTAGLTRDAVHASALQGKRRHLDLLEVLALSVRHAGDAVGLSSAHRVYDFAAAALFRTKVRRYTDGRGRSPCCPRRRSRRRASSSRAERHRPQRFRECCFRADMDRARG